MSTRLMLRQLRHDMWATEKLLEHCRTLRPDPLELTVPGTYGTIRKTFIHIVGADERYLSRFRMPCDSMLHEERNADAGLDEIATHIPHLRAGVEGLFTWSEFDPDHVIRDERRKLMITAWVLLAQFAHHGSDHRAHIGTILGANGLPTPEIDVWAYGGDNEAVGPLS
jgi:uncharacterized damage-inducible protein DinB